MKLIIHKLGRLNNAELDIRSLTVFVGPNNTNKTWAAYSLYGLASKLSRTTFSFSGNSSRSIKHSAKIVKQISESVSRLLPTLTDYSLSEVRTQLKRSELANHCTAEDLFVEFDTRGISSLLGIFEENPAIIDTNVKLVLSDEEAKNPYYEDLEFVYQLSDPPQVELVLSPARAGLLPHRVRRPINRSTTLDQNPSHPDGFQQFLKSILEDSVSRMAFTFLDNTAVLPAERKALLSLDNSFFSRSFHDEVTQQALFAAPVYDFMLMMQFARSMDRDRKQGNQFRALAELLESRILQGELRYKMDEPPQGDNPKTAQPRRKPRNIPTSTLNYVAGENIELGMHSSASIVRSLAGLDFYLKSFCNPGSLLVIDEPEMNAHPEAQLKIIELLAMIANRGVKVVLTTHSPYIIDHLNNLMQASQLNNEAANAVEPKFKLGSKDAFLSPEKVGAYYFSETGDVQDILSRDQGVIDLDNFSGPTEYLMNLINSIRRADRNSQPVGPSRS